MIADTSTPDATSSFAKATCGARRVTLSPWTNERLPPLNEILSAHDVARLIRRPKWLLAGLSLIGRFPRRMRFRGRVIGWRRSDILEWMDRDRMCMSHGAPMPRSARRRS